jgi:uncharacterized protein (TIGR04255 family)
MSTNGTNSSFEPLHKAHSIEQVSLAVVFANEIGDEELKAARKALGKPDELPGHSEMRGMSFAFSAGTAASAGAQVSGPAVGPAPSGYLFTRMRPDGTVESQLQVQKLAIAFITSSYTRWTDLSAQTRKYIDALLPIYAAGSEIAQVQLAYSDKFLSASAPQSSTPARILREGSRYLAPTVFRAQNLWHCHTGTFERVSETVKRLRNVQVEFVSETRDEQERGVLAIRTTLADMYNQPDYKQSLFKPESAAQRVYETLQELHTIDKEILRDILTDEMARRIALEA